MIKEITAAGKDVLEAKENARIALGAGPLDDIHYEIIHAGSRGIFGIIGVKPAQVKAWIELPDAGEKKHRAPRSDKSAESTESAENANNSAQDKPERRKNNNNRNKKKSQQQKKQPQQKKPQQPKKEYKEPKEALIPEEELKMELREAAAGDDMSFDFVNQLLADTGLNATATLYGCEDGTRRIIIAGEDAPVLIGHHGDTLDALQYLTNLASARKNNKGERDKSRVVVDIEGYRKKREEALRALARRMAAKAKRNRRSVMLEPMSAYERRIIHSEIQEIEGVSTNSIGSDNNRKIVIFLTDKRPNELFEKKPETPLADEFTADESSEVTRELLNTAEISAGADLEGENEEELVIPTRSADDIFEDDDSDIK